MGNVKRFREASLTVFSLSVLSSGLWKKEKKAHAVDISEGVIEFYHAIDSLLSTSASSFLARMRDGIMTELPYSPGAPTVGFQGLP